MEVPEASERVSKKQRIEQTQEAVVQLTSLVKTTLEGLQSLQATVTANTESQKLMKDEVEALAKQMGQDAITTKVVYSSLSEYQGTLTNATWQLTGHKKDANTSIKELVFHLEDYCRQISLRLLEAKNEARAQYYISKRDLLSNQIVRSSDSIGDGAESDESGRDSNYGRNTRGTGSGSDYECTTTKGRTGRTGHTGHTGRTGHTSRRWAGSPPAPGYASSAAAAAMFPPSAPVFNAPPPMAYQPS